MIFVQLCTSKITEPPGAVTNANKTWLKCTRWFGLCLLVTVGSDIRCAYPERGLIMIDRKVNPASQSVILVILKIASHEKIVLVKR